MWALERSVHLNIVPSDFDAAYRTSYAANEIYHGFGIYCSKFVRSPKTLPFRCRVANRVLGEIHQNPLDLESPGFHASIARAAVTLESCNDWATFLSPLAAVSNAPLETTSAANCPNAPPAAEAPYHCK